MITHRSAGGSPLNTKEALVPSIGRNPQTRQKRPARKAPVAVRVRKPAVSESPGRISRLPDFLMGCLVSQRSPLGRFLTDMVQG